MIDGISATLQSILCCCPTLHELQWCTILEVWNYKLETILLGKLEFQSKSFYILKGKSKRKRTIKTLAASLHMTWVVCKHFKADHFFLSESRYVNWRKGMSSISGRVVQKKTYPHPVKIGNQNVQGWFSSGSICFIFELSLIPNVSLFNKSNHELRYVHLVKIEST